MLLVGAVVIVICAWWMVAIADRRRWFGLFFSPPIVALSLWFAFSPPYPPRRAPKAWNAATWAVLGVSLLGGCLLVWRWG